MKQETVLITGAAQRLGRAMALAVAERGHRVALHYNTSAEPAEKLAHEIRKAGGTAATVQANLAEPEEVRGLVSAAAAELAPVTVLVNNASSFYPTPIAALTSADASHPDWDALIDSNQRAPFWLSLAFAHAAGDGGSIVNLVDIHGIVPLADHAIYSQAKAGLIMQTRALAKDLAPEVRVNGIAPGSILWPEGDAANSEESMRDIMARVPLKRQGRPEDIAGAVAFLALDAPYVTGQILAVDGGRLLNM